MHSPAAQPAHQTHHPRPPPPQDKAREFLCSASESARMLYKLFMEATHMADFKDKLQRTKVGR